MMIGMVPIEWAAPPSCPSAIEVREDVARLVRPGVEPHEISAEAVVRSSEAGAYGLTLWIHRGDDSERYQLDGPECAALAGAAAVLIATAIEAGAQADAQADAEVVATTEAPAGSEGSAVPEPEPVGASHSPRPGAASDAAVVSDGASPPMSASLMERTGPVGGSDPDPAPEPEPEPLPPTRLALHGGYFVGVARESPWSHGPWLGLGVLRPNLRLTVGARYAVPSRHRVQPGRALRTDGILGVARGCARLRVGALELPGCVVAEVGWVTARGRGFIRNEVARGVTVGAGVGLGLRVRLAERLRLAVDTEALAAVVFPRFSVDGVTLWRPSPVGGRATAGVEVVLGVDRDSKK